MYPERVCFPVLFRGSITVCRVEGTSWVLHTVQGVDGLCCGQRLTKLISGGVKLVGIDKSKQMSVPWATGEGLITGGWLMHGEENYDIT